MMRWVLRRAIDKFERQWQESFGRSAQSLEGTAPSGAKDPRFTAWYPWFQRQTMAPSAKAIAGRQSPPANRRVRPLGRRRAAIGRSSPMRKSQTRG